MAQRANALAVRVARRSGELDLRVRIPVLQVFVTLALIPRSSLIPSPGKVLYSRKGVAVEKRKNLKTLIYLLNDIFILTKLCVSIYRVVSSRFIRKKSHQFHSNYFLFYFYFHRPTLLNYKYKPKTLNE